MNRLSRRYYKIIYLAFLAIVLILSACTTYGSKDYLSTEYSSEGINLYEDHEKMVDLCRYTNNGEEILALIFLHSDEVANDLDRNYSLQLSKMYVIFEDETVVLSAEENIPHWHPQEGWNVGQINLSMDVQKRIVSDETYQLELEFLVLSGSSGNNQWSLGFGFSEIPLELTPIGYKRIHRFLSKGIQ